MLCKHNAWVLHHNRQVQSPTCWNVFSVADGRLWIWCKHHTCASNGLRSNFMGHTLPLHCKVLLCACNRADIGIYLVPLPWWYTSRPFPFLWFNKRNVSWVLDFHPTCHCQLACLCMYVCIGNELPQTEMLRSLKACISREIRQTPNEMVFGCIVHNILKMKS